MILAQGYTGVQGSDPKQIRAAGLGFTDGSSVRHTSDVAVARAMQGYFSIAAPHEVLSFQNFCPSINYARVFPDANGVYLEESDRWLKSWQLAELGKKCFDNLH